MRIFRAARMIILSACIAGLCACTGSSEAVKKDIEKGKLRYALFKECMVLAADMPRQSDDDVADIIEECSAQAWYMANQMSE